MTSRPGKPVAGKVTPDSRMPIPIPAISSSPNPIPTTVAAMRCPRKVSRSDSAESTPTSISTNRNSIITAPV
ncbi:Uncharacterised protein [Mycobacteroides abscessus subsp. abscessus]|nr:Uncharacterised protein [Mycobacteroides abscessus subsp. abscessus]